MALTTLATAIEGVADLVGDYLSGTCTSIGATAGASLIDARLKDKSRAIDDYFNDKSVYITAGAGVAGDDRYILDFAASTGTVTPYQAFSAQVPSASTYLIFSLFSASDIRRGLNRAIEDAYPWIAKLWVDETLDTVADTWSYNLGDYGTATYTSIGLTDTTKSWQTNQFANLLAQSGGNTSTIASNTSTAAVCSTWSPATPTSLDAYQIVHPIREVFDVSYQPDSTVTTRPYVPIPFETREHNGVITVQLRAYPPPSKALRIVGRGPLTQFSTTTTSTTEIGEPYVKALYYLAAHHLFQRTPSMSASQDRDFYEKRAAYYYGLWDREIARRKSTTPPKRIWGSGMGMVGGNELYYLAGNDTPAPP